MGRLPRQRRQQLTLSAAIIILSAIIIIIPSAAAVQSAATNFIDFLSAAANDNLAVESKPSVTIVKSDSKNNQLKRNF